MQKIKTKQKLESAMKILSQLEKSMLTARDGINAAKDSAEITAVLNSINTEYALKVTQAVAALDYANWHASKQAKYYSRVIGQDKIGYDAKLGMLAKLKDTLLALAATKNESLATVIAVEPVVAVAAAPAKESKLTTAITDLKALQATLDETRDSMAAADDDMKKTLLVSIEKTFADAREIAMLARKATTPARMSLKRIMGKTEEQKAFDLLLSNIDALKTELDAMVAAPAPSDEPVAPEVPAVVEVVNPAASLKTKAKLAKAMQLLNQLAEDIDTAKTAMGNETDDAAKADIWAQISAAYLAKVNEAKDTMNNLPAAKVTKYSVKRPGNTIQAYEQRLQEVLEMMATVEALLPVVPKATITPPKAEPAPVVTIAPQPAPKAQPVDAYIAAFNKLSPVPKCIKDKKSIDCLNQLLGHIHMLKGTKAATKEELTKVLEDTYKLMVTKELTPDSYAKRGKDLQGKPSKGLQILGGLMIALGAAVAITLGFVLTMFAAAPLAIAAAAGAASFAVLAAGGAGSLFAGRSKGLHRDVRELAESQQATRCP